MSFFRNFLFLLFYRCKVVTLDLKKECFTPGKKNYERVRNCLENYFKDSFDVIVAWDPPEDNVCPSSIASWFHKRGYKTSLCHQNVVNRTRYSIDVPIVDDSSDYHQFFEWLGIFSVDGNLKSSREKSSENISSPSVFASSQIQYIESTGFFTRRMVNNVYSAIKKYMSETNDIPWCSMDVQGFADSPISWGLKEHHFYTDGDNSYTIVFCPGGKCIIQKSLSSNNKPRIFQ